VGFPFIPQSQPVTLRRPPYLLGSLSDNKYHPGQCGRLIILIPNFQFVNKAKKTNQCHFFRPNFLSALEQSVFEAEVGLVTFKRFQFDKKFW
jgi:hypothetical protein